MREILLAASVMFILQVFTAIRLRRAQRGIQLERLRLYLLLAGAGTIAGNDDSAGAPFSACLTPSVSQRYFMSEIQTHVLTGCSLAEVKVDGL